MSDLQDRLQSVVGDTYRILDELGGGGMSRVFLAEEVDLHRCVVIKVLPPDMTGSVNVERFQREIQRFIEAWRDADAVLQPQVDEFRQRMAQLAGEGE